jgi:hypothetical protein
MRLNVVREIIHLNFNCKIKNLSRFNRALKQKNTYHYQSDKRPKAIAWLIREYGQILTDTQIAKLTSSTKPTVANIRAGNQSQPITEFRNPTDLGLCTYEELEALVEKGQRKAERERKAKEKAEKLQSTTA